MAKKKDESWKLDKWWKRAAYVIGWIGFIFSGLLFWIVAIILYTNRDKKAKEKEHELIHMYQKFIFVVGCIWSILLIFAILMAMYTFFLVMG